MSDTLEIQARERSWALSVFISKIDHAEMQRITRGLSHEDGMRLLAAVEGYRADLAIRDLIGPEIVEEP